MWLYEALRGPFCTLKKLCSTSLFWKEWQAPPWKWLNPFLLMGEQYCVSFVNWTQLLFLLLPGKFVFFFFSNYERNLGWWYNIAFLLLLKSFSFLIFPSKEPRWLNIRAPQHLLIAQVDSLCMHSPSVQFLDCKTRPSQSLPPFLGAGAVHSLLRQCVHSVPQVDHLLHEVHLPSTATQNPASGQREGTLQGQRGTQV